MGAMGSNEMKSLPDRAPFRILGGKFHAQGLHRRKLTLPGFPGCFQHAVADVRAL